MYKLDLVGEQEVRWDNSDMKTVHDYTFFSGIKNTNHHLQTGSFCTYGNQVKS